MYIWDIILHIKIEIPSVAISLELIFILTGLYERHHCLCDVMRNIRNTSMVSFFPPKGAELPPLWRALTLRRME